MDAERFLLKWNNHQSNLVTVFDQLYEQEAFTDVTLACDGRSFAAHKVILSACSPYFQQLFLSNPCKHPIIFMRDVKANDLDALLAFMYRGEINVHQQDLASFLKTAESLQIKGLSDSSDKPRDTSKILEAMEKKFSTNNSIYSNVTSSNNNNNNGIGHLGGISSLINSALSKRSSSNMMPSISSSGSLGIVNRSLMANNCDAHLTPPSKKFKPTPEEFTRILPKVKSMVPHSLMSSLPGLTGISPITLAMKNAASVGHTPHLGLPYLPSLDNSNSPSHNSDSNSPSKERKKEGYISGDTPHPVYLVSSVGGLGLNSSGNSTPSHEVKVEEEDLLDDNNFSDDPGSLDINDSLDDQALSQSFGDDNLGGGREKLTYPCRFCGKRFTQTGTCRRHERLHTAPNSFKCPFCHKGFNRKYRLKEHIISGHPEHAENKDLTVMVNNSDTLLQ